MNASLISALDTLKILFTGIVVLHHSSLKDGVLIRGYLCVEFFFFVSGWLLCRDIEKNNPPTLRWLGKRVLRLAPHAWLSLALILLAQLTLGVMNPGHKPLLHAIPDALFLQNVGIFDGGLNYPCWYLSVRVWGGLLVRAALHLPKKIFAALAVLNAAGYFTFAFCSGSFENFGTVYGIYIPLWRGITALAVGVLLCRCRETLRESGFYQKAVLPLTIAEILLTAATVALLFAPRKLWYDALFLLLLVPLLLCAASPQSLLNRIGTSRPVRWGTGLSYAVYLNHALVIELLRRYVYPLRAWTVAQQILLLFTATVSLSAVTQGLITLIPRLRKKKNKPECA